MFSKKSHGDFKKSGQKVLDLKKDVLSRLRHLRVVIENAETSELKSYFEQYFSHIYHVFYENFILLEASTKQRVHKAQREDLDAILAVFEKIFLFLPELIHSRWQFHSIGRVMQKLLHVGNGLKHRMDGMRLFLLWFQILQENASEECYLMYATLVPGFPVPSGIYGSSLEHVMTHNSKTSPNLDSPVLEVEINPIVPAQPGEKPTENLTKLLLESLLKYTVTQVPRVEWSDASTKDEAFIFLLENFKRFYLPHIFPEFLHSTSLYSPILEIPQARSTMNSVGSSYTNNLAACRVSVVNWVVSFITTHKASKSSLLADKPELNTKDSLERKLDTILKEGGDSSNSSSTTISPNSTLSMSTSTISLALPMQDDLETSGRELVQRVLYSTRDNINFVQEVLRQGFLLPMSESKAVKLSLKVYNEWIQNSMVKPVFMEEPEEEEEASRENDVKRLEHPPSLTNQISSILEGSQEGGMSQEGGVCEIDSPSSESADKTFAGCLPVVENETRGPPLVKSPSVSSDGTKAKRSNSYIGAINQAIRDDMNKCNVGAGLQRVVQVFITNSSNVFLLEPGGGSSGAPDPTRPIRDQVDICRRVLGSYRHIVMNVKLEKTTWEQLLMVLLRVTEGILGGTPSKPRLALGQQLAHILFQTLIVTWIKANLEIQVSTSLWEDFLRVLSSLTHWEELIKEWSRTMETLTRVLARRVYHLDLSNLPLDKLSEQKQKRLLGKGRQPPLQAVDLMKKGMHERSFSRGWSRCDSTSPNSMEELERKRNKMNTIGSQGDLSRIREMRQTEKDGDVISLHSSHPNLTRQRSLTVDPSLATREEQTLVTSVQIPRSSSEGELFDGFNFQRNKEDGERGEGMVKSTTFPLVNRQQYQAENGENENLLDGLSLSQSSIPLINHPDNLSIDETSLDVPLPDSNHTTPTDVNRVTPTSSLIEEIDQEVIALSPGIHYQSDGSGSGTPLIGVHSYHSGGSGSVTPVSTTPHFGYEGTSPGGLRFCNSDDTSPGGINHYNSDGSSRDTPLIGVLNDNGDITDLAKESPLMEEEEQNINIEDRLDLAAERVDADSIGKNGSVQSPDASVMSGGTRIGWHPDVAVVVWRRLLCILGDINQISDPRLHWVVLECLWAIWQMLAKIRDNQGISTDNQTTPPPPENIPPLLLFSPWLFRATYLPVGYQHGRLSAYKQLCAMTVRRQDHPLPREHLVHFYRVLHFGLVGTDQDVINTIVQYSAPDFFHCDLPGATLLILDFIQAANMITANIDLDAPRIEALSLLGSLVCFPNMFCNLTVFQPAPKDISTMVCKDIKPVKDHLISILLKCGKKEPNCEARCIALCGLGIFVYEELAHTTFHPRIKEAINVLLASLKFQNKLVGQVACDMLLVICDHAEWLKMHLPEAPKKIIEVIAMTIASLLSSTEMTEQEEDKKLIVSLMFCLSEWCISIPLSSLLEGTESKSKREAKPLLHTVFKVLQMAVDGVPTEGPYSINFSELASPDYDPHINLDSLKDGNILHHTLKNAPMEFSDYIFDEGESQSQSTYQVQSSFSSELTRLTARTVLTQLIDKLNHFPLGGGPACVTSLVNEVDDLPNFDTDDITPRLFEAENVQFFIYNDAALITLIQIPPLDDGSESQLSLATSDLRAIIRNVSGKFAWDGRIIYGPADCKAKPTRLVTREKPPVAPPPDDQVDSVFWMAPKSRKLSVDIITNNKKSRSTVPSWQEEGDSLDVLNELEQYIGFTSPECLLRPGIPLNFPFPAPIDMCSDMETYARGALLKQCDKEAEYVERYGEVESMVAEECWQTAHKDPESQFYLCRQLVSQLGLMNWDKRDEVDIVKKNEQFARELKNLDSRQCRETHKIAVLYVAEGQEDKQSVLSNSGGSNAYENFISGLGWEVDLSTHPGFMGGLQKNGSTGETAPYYATSTTEVIFHVSTRMPSGTDLNKKMRHLGNDEVHIVWSEHSRDYRRGIIATEFGDVIIVIYPLKNQLFRIQIQRKGDVPFFGPLFDGAVVDYRVLPGLVRATAINANRIKRSQLEFYQQFYEERAKYLDTIVKNHKDCSTFEDYSAHVFEPALARQKIQNTRYFTSPEASGSGPANSLTNVDSKGSLLPSKLQFTSKSTEKPQVSPSSSVTRPNRFSQPERLLASMIQPGQPPLSLSSSLSSSVKLTGSQGSGEKHSPRLGGRKEPRGDEKTPSSEVPGISTQTDLTASTSTASTSSNSSSINPSRPRSRTKRQSSSGSATSENTPPESPVNNKK
ncbi:ral GTPase-activating protein subunit alpha-1-like isoform X2 [Lytechinus variegatus]|uniref:ral GTPase-activating protein subunit alpha-1-like isoform X2 n=1 Tax=Lytechinus variegatus TaxID=7654 RepID=UPI001BB0E94A|nr:ral GTPase-activating protein subunit alpha-1-like isoform X2 [Lytechinus variegatus]